MIIYEIRLSLHKLLTKPAKSQKNPLSLQKAYDLIREAKS
jgi:hypothetical protein